MWNVEEVGVRKVVGVSKWVFLENIIVWKIEKKKSIVGIIFRIFFEMLFKGYI